MSDFMRQFLAGWQMGQDRIANQRADQAMQMRQDQEAYQRQQDLVETKMREEQLKIQKQRIDAEAKAARLEAAQKEHELRSQAQYLQGMPAPTAQDVGIQQTTPQDVGPTLDQINVPQPTMPMPSPTGGEDIQMPVLTGRQQQELALAEQQRKMREALGLKQAELEIAEPYKIAADERAAARQAAAAKARGKELSGILGSFGTARTEGQQKGVEIAQYAISQMPDWQKFIEKNKDRFGFYAGRYTKAVQSGALEPLGVKADPEMAKFTSGLANMSSSMLNALSGAAISPAEFERLKQFIPQVEDPPDALKSKMSELDKFFKFRLKNFNAPYQGAGWQPEESAGPPVDPRKLLGTFYGAEVYAEDGE